MYDVLVVEDDFALGEFLRRLLEREGLPFRLAESGPQALGLAEEGWPGVVLLDMTLPGSLDGWQVWDGLRLRCGDQTLRVIVFAAGLNSADLLEARRRSAWAILRKPVARTRLVELLRSALSDQGYD